MNRKLVIYKKYGNFAFFIKIRKWDIKYVLNIFVTEKKTFSFNNYAKIPNVRYNLQDPIDKVGSTTSFSAKDAFPSVKFICWKTETFYQWEW